MQTQIREATFNDFALFRLHPNNVEEVQVLSGVNPDTCLAITWEYAPEKNIITINNKPACIFGFFPDNIFWLFFHEDIKTLPLSFFKVCNKYVKNSNKKFNGTIYCKNTFALAWAKFLGFKIYPAENKLFYNFRKEG